LDLLIVGASTRAAAYSARRAGLSPACIDLFADRDLRAIALASSIARGDYPQGLAVRAEALEPCPWMYTGGLENHPELVDRIAARRPLWGNPGAVLRRVRDPRAVAECLGRAALPCPAVRLDPCGLPRDGRWLVKPLASAGGAGILPLEPGTAASSPSRPCYYQERIEGPGFSAIFVAGPDATLLAGVTRQRLGRPGAPLAYAGSVGPWPVAHALEQQLGALGTTLAGEFGLRGLFGVDFVINSGAPWPVEVNPRYTASVEILELALGRPLLADHRRAFDPDAPLASIEAFPQPRPRIVGKQIVFAPAACQFPDNEPPRQLAASPFNLPELGDIPDPGTRFDPGDPVLTVFAAADHPDECLSALERRANAWTERLGREAGRSRQ
jgi:predicted ATP-grasp superfamily ATP-dependent carboligase